MNNSLVEKSFNRINSGLEFTISNLDNSYSYLIIYYSRSSAESDLNAITEYIATPSDKTADAAVQKKNNNGGVVWFWGLLIVLVAGLGYILVRKDKK